MKILKIPEIQPASLEFIDDRIQDIVDTINEAFIVRTSVLDPSKFSIESRDKSRYRVAPTADTLYLYLKGIGKTISRTDLRLILRDANYFDQESPVLNYFDRVRGTYKGESHIDKLCDHITPRIFDREPEYYRERINTLIRKWMVACVAQWKDGVPNDITLGFISDEERIGKTYLTKFFIPDELDEYFAIPTKEQKISLADLFTRFLIISFDDLVGINKGTARIEEFKSYSRAKSILVHRRNDEFPVHRPRIAVSMLTANRNAEMGGFLTLDHGTTRYGLIEVDKIDKRYSQRVKVDQMWAEALLLYENSEFEAVFSDEEVQDLVSYNERYIVQTDEDKYVKLYLSSPEQDDEEAEWMTATEILHRLRHNRKILSADRLKITPQRIGYSLTAAGFVKESKRTALKSYPERRYLVKFNL